MKHARLADVARALDGELARYDRVSGGDINDAYHVVFSDGREVFVKTHDHPTPGMYEAEARGLAWLLEADALAVPDVLGVCDAWLALSWVSPGRRTVRFDDALGQGLALLHLSHPAQFGLDHDNFIGSLAQRNAPAEAWLDVFRDQRLMPILDRCMRASLLNTSTRKRFDTLFTRLPKLIGPEEPPARLHGDLWSGNVLCDGSGSPVLIDPAVYAGHREVDLAMLCLFGSPSERFFAAYDATYPLAPGYRERLGLYQLYPLLVHVALFGHGYVSQLESTLSRCL